MKILFPIILLFMMVAGQAWGATYYAAKIAGTWRYSTSVPTSSDTSASHIGGVLAAAAIGDTVVVAAGTYGAADLMSATGVQINKASQSLRVYAANDPGYSTYGGPVIFNGTGLGYALSVNAATCTVTGIEITGVTTTNPAFRVNNVQGAIFNDMYIHDVPLAFVTVTDANFTMNRCRFKNITGSGGVNTQILDIRGINTITRGNYFNNCIFEDCTGWIRALEDSKRNTSFNNCNFNGFSYEIIRLINTGISHNITFSNCITTNIGLAATDTNVHVFNNQAYATGGRISVDHSTIYNTRYWAGSSWPYNGIDDGGDNVFFPPKFKSPCKTGIVILGTDDWYMPDVPTVGSYPGQDPQYHLKLATMVESKGWRYTAAIPTKNRTVAEWDAIASLAARGHELASHTMTHPDLNNRGGLQISYNGTGSAATVSIGGNILSTNITGASQNNITVDLANPSYDTMQHACDYIQGESGKGYACTVQNALYSLSANLADVSGQSIMGAGSQVNVDPVKYYAYELGQSKAMIETNVNSRYPTLNYDCRTLVHPDDATDATERGYTAQYYIGARGKTADNNYDLNAGVGIYRIWDMYVPQFFGNANDFNGLADDEARRRISSFVEWLNYTGAIAMIYAHQESEVSLAKWQVILDVLAGSNVQVMTLGQAVDYLKTGTPSGSGGEIAYSMPQTNNIDYHLAPNSPAIGAGTNTPITGIASLTDPDGRPITDSAGNVYSRVIGTQKDNVDIGAYQYPSDSLSITTTGAATGGYFNAGNPYTASLPDSPAGYSVAVSVGIVNLTTPIKRNRVKVRLTDGIGQTFDKVLPVGMGGKTTGGFGFW